MLASVILSLIASDLSNILSTLPQRESVSCSFFSYDTVFIFKSYWYGIGLPQWLSSKEPTYNARDAGDARCRRRGLGL